MKQAMVVWFDNDTTIQSRLISQHYIATVTKVIRSARASCYRLEEAGFDQRHVLNATASLGNRSPQHV